MTATVQEDRFTVFIRLPFTRGDFVDPPPVAWSATKERELWEVLSKSSKGHEIDWKGLSQQLQVTEAFLLQQAAWLYERQLSQVRAQMRRMGTRSSNTVSPIPPSNAASVVAAQPMRRTGSGGSRVPSRLSTQTPVGETSVPGTPLKSKSLFASNVPVQVGSSQTKVESATHRPLSHRSSRENDMSSRTHSRRGSIQQQSTRSPKQEIVHEASSSDEDMTQSRMLHRRPNPAAARRTAAARRSQHTRRPSAPQLDEEDEDESPAFLPFSNTSSETTKGESSIKPDNFSSARGGPPPVSRPAIYRKSTSERVIPPESRQADPLTSSNSSAAEVLGNRSRPHQVDNRPQGRGHLPDPLSPRQQAALAAAAGLSPRLRKAADKGGHASDTSPSMGSSFSDLDDASVTQSALEEALLSGMGNTTMTMGPGTVGNVANRVSGISQALRSRYFDAKSGDAQR